MGRREEGLLTCEQVRERIYPLLLRTIAQRDRAEVMTHVAGCPPCRLALDAVRGRLGKVLETEVAEAPLGVATAPVERPRRRARFWLALTPAIPVVIAYALLIQQGLRIGRYRYEQRFLARLEKALYLYREDFGEFPSANGAPLATVLGTSEHEGPYLELSKERRDGVGHFVDHWGNRYIYRYPGEQNPRLFDVYSFGENGRDEGGGGDDIRNWETGWEKIPRRP